MTYVARTYQCAHVKTAITKALYYQVSVKIGPGLSKARNLKENARY